MAKIPQISDAEWKVMEVLWEKAPIPSNEISKELTGDTGWCPKTIQTLIGRLVKKGAIGFKSEKKGYLYFPRVSEEECKRVESENFLKRVYHGSLNMMVANFLQDKKLTKEEIDELKAILNKMEE